MSAAQHEPTPRTDAECSIVHSAANQGLGDEYGESVVDADFARKLEREIIALTAERDGALEALRLAKRMCDEALPKFNWGASFLDANAVDLLNRAPAAIAKATGGSA